MRKHLISIIFFVATIQVVNAKNTTDSLLRLLDKAIDNRQLYMEQKLQRIATLKNILNKSATIQQPMQFEIYTELYKEYSSFNYDSAFAYSIKLLNSAYALKNNIAISKAQINVGFSLLSAGLFKETLDTLSQISAGRLPDSVRLEYFFLMARTFFDLADYTGDNYYAPNYTIKGNVMLDSALSICTDSSMVFLSLSGLKSLRLGNMLNARHCYEKLIALPEIDKHKFAIEASSLSFIYKHDNEPEKAVEMLIRAAIADIESSTRETVAIRQLAENMFRKDDINRAYKYVKVALDDAYFYGARHRKVQVSDILPSIEDRQLEIVKTQRRTFLIYSVSATLFTFLIITFVVIIFRQLKILKKAKKYLSEANHKLSDMNRKLIEANKIKEEYIGHFFDTISGYINRFEKIKVNINRKITAHQTDDIKDIIATIDTKHEREQFYNNFDSIFLKIFPHFVESFNSFLKDDYLVSEPDQLLTPEVRIYALIRLGISDNDKIARFLGYSLNTIYAYKTKIKNRLNILPDDFEKKLMRIEAV